MSQESNNHSGALGSGLALFSRFPIVSTSIHPYSLNGSPVDVASGDWFVGKAAASIVVTHPILKELEIFNTHVRVFHVLLAVLYTYLALYSFLLKEAKKALSIGEPIVW